MSRFLVQAARGYGLTPWAFPPATQSLDVILIRLGHTEQAKGEGENRKWAGGNGGGRGGCKSSNRPAACAQVQRWEACLGPGWQVAGSD